MGEEHVKNHLFLLFPSNAHLFFLFHPQLANPFQTSPSPSRASQQDHEHRPGPEQRQQGLCRWDDRDVRFFVFFSGFKRNLSLSLSFSACIVLFTPFAPPPSRALTPFLHSHTNEPLLKKQLPGEHRGVPDGIGPCDSSGQLWRVRLRRARLGAGRAVPPRFHQPAAVRGLFDVCARPGDGRGVAGELSLFFGGGRGKKQRRNLFFFDFVVFFSSHLFLTHEKRKPSQSPKLQLSEQGQTYSTTGSNNWVSREGFVFEPFFF